MILTCWIDGICLENGCFEGLEGGWGGFGILGDSRILVPNGTLHISEFSGSRPQSVSTVDRDDLTVVTIVTSASS